MSNPLKKLAGETAIYGLSSIIGRALNYLLVPFYTSIFAAEVYGIVGELYAYVAFFNVLYLFGLETAYFRFANKKEHDEKDIFNKAQSFVFFTSIIISGSLFLLATPIANILEFQGKENYIIWLAIIMAIDAVVAIPFAQLRFYNKAKKYATLKLINISLNVGLNLFFLLFCKHVMEGRYLEGLQPIIGNIYSKDIGVGYVFISNLIANAVYLPMLFSSFAKWKFQLNFQLVKPLINYGFPLMLMGFAGIINETLDRGFLKFLTPKDMYPELSNQAVVGIYNACYKISIFMSLGIQAFRYAAEPFFFSQAQDKNAPQLFSKVMNWFVYIGCFIALFISINLDWVAPIILRRPEYLTGLAIVPVLLAANLFLGIYYNLSIWFKLSDKTRWGAILSVIGAIITIVGNILLIPVIGYMGSAWTTLACYFSMALMSYFIGNKHYPIPYNILKIVFIIGLALGLYILYLNFSSVWLNLISILAFTLCGYFVIKMKK